MPTYQYACTACHHELEAVQSFTDDALTECPECGGRLRKLFGNVGVVFKGSGFYRNDSRSGSSSTGSGSSTDSAKADAPASGSTGPNTDSGAKTSTSSTSSSSSTTSSSSSADSSSKKSATTS